MVCLLTLRFSNFVKTFVSVILIQISETGLLHLPCQTNSVFVQSLIIQVKSLWTRIPSGSNQVCLSSHITCNTDTDFPHHRTRAFVHVAKVCYLTWRCWLLFVKGYVARTRHLLYLREIISRRGYYLQCKYLCTICFIKLYK